MIEAALYDIPVEYRERFEELLDETSVPLEALEREVDAYLETVRQLAAVVQGFDMGLAERLARSALALLEHARGDVPSEAELLVQAAVKYFVREDDDEEITGVLGFDDDVQVLNAVARQLGRDDLVVPFRREPA